MLPDFDARRACHWMLLRLAGRMPDGVMTTSRRLLAEERYAEMARAVRLTVAGRAVPLRPDDTRCLLELLEDESELSEIVKLGPASLGDPMPRHQFHAAGPGPETRAEHADRAAIAAAAGEPAVNGVWRAWRVPGEAYRGVAKRVFVVEVDRGSDPAGFAARLQERLLAAGESHPQVEVYEVGDWLPAYQRTARAEGELLWSRTPDPGIRIAPLLDGFIGIEPGHCGDAESIEDETERESLLRYLEGGVPVLITTARIRDMVDRDRGRVVPMSFRTDGRWIWNDVSAYYLRVHGYLPDGALVRHIRSMGYQMPQVDGVAEYRAISVLYWSEEEGAAAGGKQR